jgi:hypothetical protein
MKKAMMYTLMVGISVIVCAAAMAKKETRALPAPGNFACTPSDLSDDGVVESMCFIWNPVDGADKYSIDVEVEVDTDGDGVSDRNIELSFGTGDRTDGEDPSLPKLCVPLTEFVFDIDDDEVNDQLYGTFTAKVKALNPGKGRGRQNHPFSAPFGFELLPPDTMTME